LKTGDRVRIDLRNGTADVLLDATELEGRRQSLASAGGYAFPPSQTPWEALHRARIGQLDRGAILEGAEEFQRIAQSGTLPRDNH